MFSRVGGALIMSEPELRRQQEHRSLRARDGAHSRPEKSAPRIPTNTVYASNAGLVSKTPGFKTPSTPRANHGAMLKANTAIDIARNATSVPARTRSFTRSVRSLAKMANVAAALERRGQNAVPPRTGCGRRSEAPGSRPSSVHRTRTARHGGFRGNRFRGNGLPVLQTCNGLHPVPRFPPNGRGDMTRELLCGPHCPRAPGRSESLFLERIEKCSQCSVKNGRGIAVGHAMAEQILSPPELLVGFGGDRELHFVSPRGEWLDLLATCGAHWNPIAWRFGRLGSSRRR